MTTQIYKFFGYSVYAHVNDEKLAPRVKKCIFLGYASESKGYCLWSMDHESRKVILSHDITFDENILPFSEKDYGSSSTETDDQQGNSKKVELEMKSLSSPNVDALSLSTTHQSSDDYDDNDTNEYVPQQQDYSIARDRPMSVITMPARFRHDDEDQLVSYALSIAQYISENVQPVSYRR